MSLVGVLKTYSLLKHTYRSLINSVEQFFLTQQASMEIRESYDISYIQGPEAVFPDQEVPQLRTSIVELAEKTKELGFRFLRSLALALDLVTHIV